MDSDVSKIVKRSTFRVTFSGASGSCDLVIPQGSLESVVICALSAGSDVYISCANNASYRIL